MNTDKKQSLYERVEALVGDGAEFSLLPRRMPVVFSEVEEVRLREAFAPKAEEVRVWVDELLRPEVLELDLFGVLETMFNQERMIS